MRFPSLVEVVAARRQQEQITLEHVRRVEAGVRRGAALKGPRAPRKMFPKPLELPLNWEQEFRRLHAAGATDRELGATFGASDGWAWKQRKRLQIPTKYVRKARVQ